MADKNPRRNPTTDALFDAILSLETREECYNFFEDLCTVKEISDMAQRLEAAKLLLSGSTYDQIVKAVEISTATISRINRCIQYGSGGYRDTIEKVQNLSHILCAESQKMKAALSMEELDLCKLLEVNDSATNMVHAVANLELVLKEKLEFIANNLYYPSTGNCTTTES